MKFAEHKQKWINCCRCSLCDVREKVVLLRGSIPCTILFIGESPGVSENVIGKPFCGEAGYLLNDIIEEAYHGKVKIAFTNIVGCIPLVSEDGGKADPPDEAIETCSPRVREIVMMCKPQAIVCLGDLSYSRMPSILNKKLLKDVALFHMMHPARILRMDKAQQGLAKQRCVVILKDVLEELCNGK